MNFDEGKPDLQALWLNGTCCHKTGTRAPCYKHFDNRLYVLESIMFLNISIQEKGPLQGCEELEVFYGLLGALKQWPNAVEKELLCSTF